MPRELKLVDVLDDNALARALQVQASSAAIDALEARLDGMRADRATAIVDLLDKDGLSERQVAELAGLSGGRVHTIATDHRRAA